MIVNQDCFELMRSMPDGAVDLVLTDPPYGTTDLPFDKIKIDWEAWRSEIHRTSKPNAVIACFAAQPFTTDLINSNRRNFRYDLVWHKAMSVGFLSANVRPLRAHESILIFCRKFGRRRVGQSLVMQSAYNPQFIAGAPYKRKACAGKSAHYGRSRGCPPAENPGRRFPTSVLQYGLERPSPHPTAKPLELCRWLVRTYSHAGDLVFDPFAGAGAVPLAALLEGREIIASELNPEYFATIQRRAETLGLQF